MQQNKKAYLRVRRNMTMLCLTDALEGLFMLDLRNGLSNLLPLQTEPMLVQDTRVVCGPGLHFMLSATLVR